jgi:hypothetical protein
MLPNPGGSAVVGGYLSQLGLTSDAIYYINENPADIQWLSADDAARFGIYIAQSGH